MGWTRKDIKHFPGIVKKSGRHAERGAWILCENPLTGEDFVLFSAQKPRSRIAANMASRKTVEDWLTGFRTGRGKTVLREGEGILASWVFPCRDVPEVDTGDGRSIPAYECDMLRHYARPHWGIGFMDESRDKSGKLVFSRLYMAEEGYHEGTLHECLQALEAPACIIQLRDADGVLGGTFVRNDWRNPQRTGRDAALEGLHKLVKAMNVRPEDLLTLSARCYPLRDYELSTMGDMVARCEIHFFHQSVGGRRVPVTRPVLTNHSDPDNTEHGIPYLVDICPYVNCPWPDPEGTDTAGLRKCYPTVMGETLSPAYMPLASLGKELGLTPCNTCSQEDIERAFEKTSMHPHC